MEVRLTKLLGGVHITRVVTAILAIAFTLTLQGRLSAVESKPLVVHATGIITSQTFCSGTELCQEATVTGQATRLGSLTGVLFERVDLTTGAYAGTGVFTLANGDTIETDYVGQVFPPDEDGTAIFIEDHVVVGGTGRFADATGALHVTGTATATREVSIDGVGTLSR